MAIDFNEQKRDKVNRITKIIKEDLPSVINKLIKFKRGVVIEDYLTVGKNTLESGAYKFYVSGNSWITGITILQDSIVLLGANRIIKSGSHSNASNIELEIPVSGTDATNHAINLKIDTNKILSVKAKGDGAGGIVESSKEVDITGQLKGNLLNNQMVSLATFDILSLMTAPKFLNLQCDDPGSGVMYDASGNGHNGSYQGGMTTSDRVKEAMGWLVNYDGSNDLVTFTDHNDFSFGDASNDSAFTFICLINVVDGSDRSIFSKWDEYTAGGLREWDIKLTSAEKIQLLQYDESVDKQCSRLMNSAASVGWHLVGITTPGDGGATAMNNVKIYIDGSVIASTATNDADYVAMENTLAQPRISAIQNSAGNPEDFYDSDMAMIGFDGSEWSAIKMNQLWHLTKGLYGL